MAVSAPILEREINTENNLPERKINTVKNITPQVSSNPAMTSDESHNARIKFNYAKIIDPEMTVQDIFNNDVQPKCVEEPVAVQIPAEAQISNVNQMPELVDSARVDTDLFRVNSLMNNRQPVAAAEPEQEQEDEENEDLRPSEETFKYRTLAASKTAIDSKVSNKQVKVSKFSKRDKVIMAVALLVIVALFVLVIVNSAVLSNLHGDVSSLQSDLVVAEQNYTEVKGNSEDFWDNIEETVSNFARKNGMKNIGDNKN